MTQRVRAAVVAALSGCLLALVPASAAAEESPHLAEAREAMDSLEYERALKLLEKALASGDNDPAATREIHRALGEVQASLGRRAEAEVHFRQLLALDADADIGEGISPKIRIPFDAAQEYLATRGQVELRCDGDAAENQVAVRVDNDPVDIVAGARVFYRAADDPAGEPQMIEERGRGSQRLTLPSAGGVEFTCAAIDEYGNRLLEIGSWEQPLRMQESAPVVVSEETGSSTPIYGRWWLWGSAAVVAGGVGGYFGYQVSQDQAELDELNQNSAEHDFAEAEAVAERGERNALIANIAIGAAGVFAAASVIALIVDHESDEPQRDEGVSALSPMLLPGGGGFTVSLDF
ncbi:hypothetical protein [Haliangium ochraceum]|uniref:Uncharacterized protein n=1 Tax=Haliangium ochraceum (strain DSM 14365 / JCM 11303 / SMP-2) TaxID=502025 RepID=D0LQC8_HALO1|nr:hypothetical protein [Haliangium ochraceum]ACY18937.1 hypothetical protein Hoch_6468 [Haliangium ochraceum DSM 14365]